MNKKRNWVLRIAFFIAIILTAAFVYIFVNINIARHKSIKALIPIDVNGDGEDEILIYYNPPEEWSENSSLLEAVDSHTGKPLWSIMTSPAEWAAQTSRQDLLVTQGIAIIFSAKHVGSGNCGDYRKITVAAHSIKDGKLLWTYDFQGETDAHPYWSIIADNNNVYSSVATCGKDKRRITRLESLVLRSGKPLWKIELPCESLSRPILFKNNLLVWAHHNWIIDKANGTTYSLTSNGPFRILDDTIYAFDWDKSGNVPRLNVVDIQKKRLNPILLDGKHLYWEQGIRAYDGIFGSDALFFPTKSPAPFEYTLYKESNITQKANSTDPFKLDNSNFYYWTNVAAEFAPHLVVGEQYTMFFLYDNSRKEKYQADWRLALLDTKNKNITWRSKTISGKQRPISRYHHRIENYEILIFDIPNSPNKSVGCMLVFNRHSGRFINALKISNNNGPFSADDIGWQRDCPVPC